MHSFSQIKTSHGSKYLQQLCKHFAHKVDVTYDATEGQVDFPPGPCTILADEEMISFSCISEKAEGLLVMQSIIEQHLVKFAWREDIEFAWHTSEGSAPENKVSGN